MAETAKVDLPRLEGREASADAGNASKERAEAGLLIMVKRRKGAKE
jgi:hypothetical protein